MVTMRKVKIESNSVFPFSQVNAFVYAKLLSSKFYSNLWPPVTYIVMIQMSFTPY